MFIKSFVTFGRGRRPARRALALGLTTAVALTGWAGATRISAEAASGHTLIVAYAGLPSTWTFDAASPGGYENLEFGVNTQAGLVRQAYYPNAKCGCLLQNLTKFQGVLASSWTVSKNGLVYTFHLRKGVKSQAGDPLTAEDVLYSFQRKFGAATSITPYVQGLVLTDPAKQIKAVNSSTVSFTLAKPGYGFTLLSLLANVTGYIYDSKLLKEHASKADPYAVNWSNQNPNIGFGAYERTAYTPGTSMTLTANPNYVLAKPYYSTIDFRVQADPGTRTEAVESGAADVAVQLTASDQSSLAKVPAVKVYTFPSTNMFTMLTMDTLAKPFNNPKVRDALAMAVPYQQILKSVYQGRGIPTRAGGVVDPTMPNFDSAGLSYPTYDPTAAKKLLAEAGYPNGISFPLTVSNAVPDVQEAAVQVESYASAAGFHITINQQPAAAVSAGISSRKFEAYMWRDMAISSAPYYEMHLWYPTVSGGKPGPTDSSGWTNAQYTAIVAEAGALADQTGTAASKMWNEAMRINASQVSQIYIGRIQPQNAFRSDITGYANRLDNDVDYSMLKSS
jgi:peptide/nickel transport system substrate-binding protein